MRNTFIIVVAFMGLVACSEDKGQEAQGIVEKAAGQTKNSTDKTNSVKVAISEKPLQGSINGVKVSGFKGMITPGKKIKLFTGEDHASEFGTRLVLAPGWESPLMQSLQVSKDDSADFGVIHFESKDHTNINRQIQAGYELWMQTGDALQSQVPMKMRLTLEGDYSVQLEGTVMLEWAEGTVRQKTVNPRMDEIDSIIYLGEQAVIQEFEGKKVEFIRPDALLMQHLAGVLPGQLQYAYMSARFYLEGEGPFIRKMQMAKKDGMWQIHKVLPEEQILMAHPVNQPSEERNTDALAMMAGQRFEESIYKVKGGWTKVKEPVSPFCREGLVEGDITHCRIAYGMFGEDINKDLSCYQVTYLFKKTDGQWQITETLPDDKMYNYKKKKIEDRTAPVSGC